MHKKFALVTGAGSGIGRAVALKLADAGYHVAIAGRRESLLNEVRVLAGDRCLVTPADVADADSVRRLFEQIKTTFGRLDVLFNNAGTAAKPQPLTELALSDWQRVMDTNTTGAFLCTQAAFRLMQRQQPQGGRIINNGSISATTPRPHMVAYTVSKHAITGLTKATALEGRGYNIACGQIDIGNTVTDLTAPIAAGSLQADGSIKPEPSFDVRHVADAVLYMANLPLDANVLSMTVMATSMPFVGRG